MSESVTESFPFPKTTEPYAKVMVITPNMAKSIIEFKSDKNFREKNQDHIKYLSKQMESGNFNFNGESIVFDKDRNLVDGQHRLLACVESGCDILTTVSFNSYSDLAIDSGKNRSLTEYLKYMGKKNASNLAPALNILVKHYTYDDIYSQRGYGRARPTRDEALQVLDQHPDIETYITKCSKCKEYVAIPVMAACIYIFSTQNKDLAEKFLEDVHLASQNSNCPAYHLKSLLSLWKDKTKQGINTSTQHKISSIFKSWNYYATGTSITSRKSLEPKRTNKDGLVLGKLPAQSSIIPVS